MRQAFRLLIIAALSGCLASAVAASSPEWVEGDGEVVGVIDGDTLDVLVTADVAMSLGFRKRKNPLALRLRLDQIDAPERGAAWSNRSKQALSALVFGKTVRFRSKAVDRYERDIAEVFLGDLWVNLWMIEQGHGWAYRRYASQPVLTCSVEEKARAARRGLWSQPTATWIAPWDWRKQVRSAGAVPTLEQCLRDATSRE